ncbi:MAG: Mu transposase C-terminal domain-containing protein, partial [Acetobacterium sp.]|nr:Mu transposase C-terminal domain-containing protein [Acetobacterium sp.]
EAVMKTIKDDFQGEAARAGFQNMEELNTALWAWIDVEYNMRNHSSTGEAPADRFLKGLPAEQRRVSDLKWFEYLFLLRETRTVTKYGNIKLCGNQYHTDTASHGTVVEIRYDPFDLRAVYLFENGKQRETLKVRTMINEKAPHVPEEKVHKPEEISAESARYFTRLRERQEEAKKIVRSPDYTKLRGDHA